MAFNIELDREDDGRWIAEVTDLGALAYGQSRQDASTKVETLALRILADRIENGEIIPPLDRAFAVPA